jgi:hypothetical protein
VNYVTIAGADVSGAARGEHVPERNEDELQSTVTILGSRIVPPTVSGDDRGPDAAGRPLVRSHKVLTLTVQTVKVFCAGTQCRPSFSYITRHALQRLLAWFMSRFREPLVRPTHPLCRNDGYQACLLRNQYRY